MEGIDEKLSPTEESVGEIRLAVVVWRDVIIGVDAAVDTPRLVLTF